MVARLAWILPKQLKDWVKWRAGASSEESSLCNMRRHGFSPRWIVDVGAYRGEWTRMAAGIFPQARLLMIEANPERAARPVEMLERNCRLQFVSALVGEKERKDVAFYVDESASSVLIAGQAREADLYLPMTTLDRLIKEAVLAGPDLIKLDVQGYELPVLCGARRALRSVQAVMMEVNLIEVYRGAALLDEMVAFM